MLIARIEGATRNLGGPRSDGGVSHPGVWVDRAALRRESPDTAIAGRALMSRRHQTCALGTVGGSRQGKARPLS